MAIVRALEEVPRDRTVVVHADSPTRSASSARAGRPRPTRSSSSACASSAREFRDLRLVKVAGHAGVAENERADELARMAVNRRAAELMRARRAGPRRRHGPVGLDLHRHQGHRARRAADALSGVRFGHRGAGAAGALRRAALAGRASSSSTASCSASSTRSGCSCRCSGRSTPPRRSRRSSPRSTRRSCRWSRSSLYRTRPSRPQLVRPCAGDARADAAHLPGGGRALERRRPATPSAARSSTRSPSCRSRGARRATTRGR